MSAVVVAVVTDAEATVTRLETPRMYSRNMSRLTAIQQISKRSITALSIGGIMLWIAGLFGCLYYEQAIQPRRLSLTALDIANFLIC